MLSHITEFDSLYLFIHLTESPLTTPEQIHSGKKEKILDMADEEGSGVSDQQYFAEIAARDKEVTALLTKKNKAQALNVSLQSPPLGTKSGDVKVRNC